jgi:ferredoxin
MPHVVTDSCRRCKIPACVDICPMDCFHKGETMLVINSDKCIDCGVCALACKHNAINDGLDEIFLKWVSFNKEHSKLWPEITISKCLVEIGES